MDFETIEEDYRKELEKIDSDFVKGIENKQDIKSLEETYRLKSAQSREKYYVLMKKYIEEQKKASLIKKKKEVKKEKLSELNVVHQNFDIGFRARTKLNWALKYFKFKFKLRNSVRRSTPYFFSYHYTKFRIRIKWMNRRISEYISDSISDFKTKITSIWEKTKEFFTKTYKKLADFPSKIISFIKKVFSKKKKDEKGKEGEKKTESKNE